MTTKQTQIGEENYLLLSFGPISGTGIYEVYGETHRFDLLRDEDIQLDDAVWQTMQFVWFDQVEANLTFTDQAGLHSFVRQEYLRYKKYLYYALMFSQELNEDLNIRTLTILNSQDFVDTKISGDLVSVLVETAKPHLVSRVIRQAYGHRLENVKLCLITELKAILPPIDAIARLLSTVTVVPIRSSTTRSRPKETATSRAPTKASPSVTKYSGYEAYCVKCKAKRVMKDAQVVTSAKGRKQAKGVCPHCGTKMNMFLKG